MSNAKLPQAKKSLGQHFLVNSSVCERIVALLDIEPIDQILEIGPGPGALSKILLNTPCSRLEFIEKDNFWAEQLNKNAHREIFVYNMDALQFPWAQLIGSWKIIGNLPYNIASPLIWDLVAKVPHLERAVFMVQLEVAERIVAKANSRLYGALSVWIQSYCHVTLEFKVSPGSFRPPPKVDSAIILLLPKSSQPSEPEKLNMLLKICFQNRRKQLNKIFKMQGLTQMLNALSSLNINPAQRPENLSPETFDKLSAYMP